METNRDDFIIAIRSAFLKKGTKQRFSLIVLLFFSITILVLGKYNFKGIVFLKTALNEIVYRSTFIISAPENFIKNTYKLTISHINLYEDHKKLTGSPPPHAKIMRVGRHTNDLWEQMLESFEYAEQFYFAGGEPIMMEEHYRVLKELDKRKMYQDVYWLGQLKFCQINISEKMCTSKDSNYHKKHFLTGERWYPYSPSELNLRINIDSNLIQIFEIESLSKKC